MTTWQSSEIELLGGATALQGRFHRLAKLGDLAQAVPPLDLGGVTTQLSWETELMGGATAS